MALEISYTVMKSVVIVSDAGDTNEVCVHVRNTDAEPVADGVVIGVVVQAVDHPPALSSSMDVSGLGPADIQEQWFQVPVSPGVPGPYLVYTDRPDTPVTSFEVTTGGGATGTWPIAGAVMAALSRADAFGPLTITPPGAQDWPQPTTTQADVVDWTVNASDGRPNAVLKLAISADFAVVGGGAFPTSVVLTVVDFWPENRQDSYTGLRITAADLVCEQDGYYKVRLTIDMYWVHLGMTAAKATAHVTITAESCLSELVV